MYRDVFERTTPGLYVLYGWAFQFLGWDIIYPRTISFLNDLLVFCCLGGLLHRRLGPKSALWGLVAYVFWGVAQFHFLWYSRLAVLPLLLALYFLTAPDDKAFWRGVAAGALAFVSYWFKQNLGAGGFLILFAAALLPALLSRALRRGSVALGAGVLAGFGLSLLGYFFLLQASGRWEGFVAATIVMAASTKKGFLSTMLLPSAWVVRVVYAAAVFSIVVSGFQTWRKNPQGEGLLRLSVAAFGMFGAGMATGTDLAHVFPYMSLGILLLVLAWRAGGAWVQGRWARLHRVVPPAACTLFAAYGLFNLAANRGMSHEWGSPLAQSESLFIK